MNSNTKNLRDQARSVETLSHVHFQGIMVFALGKPKSSTSLNKNLRFVRVVSLVRLPSAYAHIVALPTSVFDYTFEDMTPRISFCIYALLLILVGTLRGDTPDDSLHFVQLTDNHLFDCGKIRDNEPPENGPIERANCRLAWDWAIVEINRLWVAGQKPDFVVFTGDFGLEKLSIENECAQLRWGASLIADDLSNLLVKTAYVVRGNNDLLEENPSDAGRFDVFVRFVAQDLKSRGSNLEIINLTPSSKSDTCVKDSQLGTAQSAKTLAEVKGFKIVGLDSSSFKNMYPKDKGCNHTDGDQPWKDSLPHRYQDQETELQRIKNLILSDGKPTILFTHIPDLDDPWKAENCKDNFASWHLSDRGLNLWKEITTVGQDINPNLKAIFAGHFHDSNQWKYLYPYDWQKSTSRNLKIEAITYLAPPLAAKFQGNESPPARGLRIATLSLGGKIKSEIRWFNSTQSFGFLERQEVLKNHDDGDSDWKRYFIVSATLAVALAFALRSFLSQQTKRIEELISNFKGKHFPPS